MDTSENMPQPHQNEEDQEIQEFFMMEKEQALKGKPTWLPDHCALNCMKCGIRFSLTRRRHHCRYCGYIFCKRCSCYKSPLPTSYRYDSQQRVCVSCFSILNANEKRSTLPIKPTREYRNSDSEIISRQRVSYESNFEERSKQIEDMRLSLKQKEEALKNAEKSQSDTLTILQEKNHQVMESKKIVQTYQLFIQTIDKEAQLLKISNDKLVPLKDVTKSGTWFYKGRFGEWIHFDIDRNCLMNYRDNSLPRPLIFSFGDKDFVVDFKNMSLIDRANFSHTLELKYEKFTSPFEANSHHWYFVNPNGEQPFDFVTSNQIESAHIHGRKQFSINIHGNEMHFDLDKYLYTHPSYKSEISIKRKKNILDPIRYQDNCLIQEFQTAKFIPPSALQFITNFTVTLCLTEPWNFIRMIGKKSSLDSARDEILSFLNNDRDIEWIPQKTYCILVQLAPYSPEFKRISNKIGHKQTIVKIERIQNKILWKDYYNERENVRIKNNGEVNEMELFYCDPATNPALIFGGDAGFDVRFATPKSYGSGLYFLVDSPPSSQQFKSESGRQFFLAKVIAGHSSSSVINRKMRMPPEKSRNLITNSPVGFQTDRYDSVLGHLNGTVYVVYNNNRAYPQYLITTKM